MVAQMKSLVGVSEETRKILDTISEGKSFLLSGGAGSGKTYSLVEVITNLVTLKPLARVACITYTNAAVREIEGRASHPNLHVSTIHDFLWGVIKHFQVELKEVLLALINDDEISAFKVLDANGESTKLAEIEGEVRYKEYVKFREGVISHDEVIVLANEMFKRYDKLCRILKDCYPYVLVDEYQDTQAEVVDILLTQLTRVGDPNVVGFFGDAMQAIYDEGIGDLDSYKGEGVGQVREIKKEENRRNPKNVIDLANKLRSDGLHQVPSKDLNAPNMDEDGNVKSGCIQFLYSSNDDVNIVKKFLGWNFSEPSGAKELNLTHNLIAAKAGFSELMRIYDGDKILEYVRRVKNYIKKSDADFVSDGKTFGEVLLELKCGKVGKALKDIEPTDGMAAYIAEHQAVYNEALGYQYSELASLYVDKDQLIDDQKSDRGELGRGGGNRDDLIKHLFKIQKNVQLYLEGNFNEFLRITEHAVTSKNDKVRLKEKVVSLSQVDGKTVQQVIDEANTGGLVRVDDRLQSFVESKRYIYNQVAALPFVQFQKLFEYLEGFTPFSTQHKTKGREFPDVLVVLNNGRWNSYNFEYLFTDRADKESVVSRTRKILYVCCTRAKSNLALFYHSPSDAVIEKAKVWFGNENVRSLD
ncbi:MULTISPECIES: ATP-dependent helicase [unclassified Pseudomonas]|uniref:ATP-dependent helicase n=1 Tax=unclassified Pseudomonas TaxID=196821 RepID=UPI0004807CDE|nr:MULTISPECIES: ATP-dependent helicase [unclassified Pseudomonas]RAS27727.1 DNA helicase-2/ATP-dependent DNA helicase PcrA [Pseudomonas sp. URMO17WK12:I7]SMF46777.1 DNA helicase-2 / ATP-dependent DNA helicase PcrA [Pseudomonas sp. URMO17WK12:I5]